MVARMKKDEGCRLLEAPVTWIGPSVVDVDPPLVVPDGTLPPEPLADGVNSTSSAVEVALGTSEVAEGPVGSSVVGVGVLGPIGLGAVFVFTGA